MRSLAWVPVVLLVATATAHAEPPGAADARAIARTFLSAAPPLVADVTPDELESARASRQDDHAHGPTVVLVTARFAVRVALVTREVVAFSRCAACLPLGELEARCAPASGLARTDGLEAAALAFASRRFPDLRWNGQTGWTSHGDHAAEERSFYARLAEEPRGAYGGAWAHVVVNEATGEVTALRRSPAPVTPPTGPIAIPVEQARERALAALDALGREGDERPIPELVTLREPTTGEPRRYWVLKARLRGHHGAECACSGGEDVAVHVDAVTGRLQVVR